MGMEGIMKALNVRNAVRRITGMRRRTRRLLVLLILLGIVYWYALPSVIFDTPYSTVLEARDGELLSASIAPDGQWRFPPAGSVPQKFVDALVAFEDQRFFQHPGVDPLAMGRALIQNLRHGAIVSGGSTLSMQVIRLSRRGRPRTVLEKCIEIILATRLELRFSKQEILALYASHAPFGGNVVGLDAACWRYFGRSSQSLSWGEAALLAVLPNAPALMHPGKNRAHLTKKRDKLLDKLMEAGKIDAITCRLSKEEALPEAPRPLPRLARHLLVRMTKEGLAQRRLKSTIAHALQQRVEEKLQDHHARMIANQVFNGAVLVVDVKTGAALAYAGNVDAGPKARGQDVDIITAARSTGSILKPFLYAAALDEGLILPRTLLPDVPVYMNGFAPENFSRQYDGAVPASEALIRSLNVPAVFLLRDYRYEKFHSLLKRIGLTTLHQPADHYGLSLILGGAEGTLWDITGMYASMARTLNNYFEYPGQRRYHRTDFHEPFFHEEMQSTSRDEAEATSWLSASSIYLTFDALKELYRPVEEAGWKLFSTSKPIAWKTGTSFGFRDAWAVGVTPDYAVGVWIGNADGEGRAGLTGTAAAAPLLFDIFSLLPASEWFQRPASELHRIATCSKSGERFSPDCEAADTVWATRRGLETAACSYHKTIHVSSDMKFRVHSGCADVNDLVQARWFVLPPVQEYYYRMRNVSYKPLPPFRPDCANPETLPSMALVYPRPNARLFLPRDFGGKPGSSIFQLAHRDPAASVFWHLDGVFIGTTRGNHRLAINPGEGEHTLTIIDENGQSLEEHFTVISRL